MNNKVLVFISPNVKKDGAEKSLVALQIYLNREIDLKTLVVIPEHGEIEELLIQNCIDYRIHRFVGIVNAGRGKKILRGVAKYFINRYEAIRLCREFKKSGISVLGVHSNTITSDFGYYLSKTLKVPHIWHIREFGKYDFNFDFELGMNYISKCANQSARIICNSEAVENYYKQFFSEKLLTHVYNGVPIVQKGINCWDESTFRILMIGRLSSEKGQEDLINACEMMTQNGMSDYRVDLYGDGVDREKLQVMITTLNLKDRIFLKGYSADIPICDYHVGVMCSKYEAFGRVTVEYMANSLPVVGANSGGTPEIIVDNDTGLLYQPGDVEALYECMRKLYLNRELCKKLGRNGKERAERLFSEEEYCRNIVNVYHDVFKGEL